MEVRVVAPQLQSLDDVAAEVCACTVFSDDRPARGLAGLLDWRLAGRFSALLTSRFFVGDVGETLLVPGRPHLPFEKVVFAGLGPREAFDDAAFAAALDRLATLLSGLRVRRAVVELPGRAANLLPASVTIPLALERLSDLDSWWLVDDAAAQRVLDERVRRRIPSADPV